MCFCLFYPPPVEGLDPDVSSCEEGPLPEPSPEIRITVKDEPEELGDSKLVKCHTMRVNVYFNFINS